MYQIIEQTHEEKVKMYSKLSKKELIEMLIEANLHLNSRKQEINFGLCPNGCKTNCTCPKFYVTG